MAHFANSICWSRRAISPAVEKGRPALSEIGMGALVGQIRTAFATGMVRPLLLAMLQTGQGDIIDIREPSAGSALWPLGSRRLISESAAPA